jgi:hypothetical protein
MSYQERRAIVSILSSILISALYTAYMLQRYPDVGPYSPEVFRYWGSFFLILIPVSIVARIIIAIAFAIINAIATRETDPDKTDERDKLIESKATQNAGYIFILGFLLAMGSQAFGMPPAVMFAIFMGSGLLTDIVSEALQFHYYRSGV